MDDKKIATVLKAIDFSPLLQYFIDEEFTYESFQLLTLEMVKDFLPKAGPRTLFWSKYTKYFQNQQAAKSTTLPVISTKFYSDDPMDTEDPLDFTNDDDVSRSPAPEESEDDEKVPFVKEEPQLTEFVLEGPTPVEEEVAYLESIPMEIKPKEAPKSSIDANDILADCLNSLSGVMIVNKYNKFKSLNDKDRTQLCRLIIYKEFERVSGESDDKFRISTHRFTKLRDQICEAFPNETPDVYYTPYNKLTRSLSTGKLYAAFNSFKRRWKESQKTTDGKDDEDSDEPSTSDVSPEIRELLNVASITDKALQLWKKTHTYRQKLLSNPKYTMSKYYDQFPLLKQPNGYQLLLLDFDMMHKNHTKNLLKNWPQANQELICMARKKMNKEKFRELSVSCPNDILGFLLLTYHLPMAYKTSKNPQLQKRIRLCREEIQEELILHVKDNESLWNVLECDNEQRVEAGFPINPRIIFVGQDFAAISKVYVEIDMNMYEMKNPLSAIDTYLKVSMALNITYPNEVKQIWTFMQHYVYKIKTAKDISFTSVNVLMADLENDNALNKRAKKRKHSSDSD
ncbi:hypothetical protein DMENIID0001_138890 [Sergentomyia squamirostris]